ncbi:MAG: 5'-deoxynucleotidase [Oscillospiraceae bacterium]|nr:5'-deoxynucleotidase [Oscillospiraceae bacterium]
MSRFFAIISRMKYINRWGLMRNTISENISEHSLETAFISHLLAVLRNTRHGGNVDAERCALLAMYHDVAEIITGDLPTPVKYYSKEIKNAYAIVEENAEKQLLSYLPDDIRDVYSDIIGHKEKDEELWKLIKAADKISALIKCTEELQMGNKDFEKAYNSTLSSIKALNVPEADEFLDEFMPAYSLTLDEQA